MRPSRWRIRSVTTAAVRGTLDKIARANEKGKWSEVPTVPPTCVICEHVKTGRSGSRARLAPNTLGAVPRHYRWADPWHTSKTVTVMSSGTN